MKFKSYKSSIRISTAKKANTIHCIKILHDGLNKVLTECPHCHNKNIIKYGHFSDNMQRYRCKDCNKTFSGVTNSIFSYSKKKLIYWIKYLNYMKEEFTIRKSAYKLKMSNTTAFYWRHKILKALNDKLPSNLNGVVEIKTTYIKESFKGKRYPKSYQRTATMGTARNDYANIADTRICVLCCHDNSGNIFSKTLCRGSINYAAISDSLKCKLSSDCEICSDNNLAYVSFAKINNIKIHKMQYNTQVLNGKFHIRNAVKFGNHIKEIVSQCRGVCTRYLNFYIAWTKWLFNYAGQNCFKDILKTLAYNRVKFINNDLYNVGELGQICE